MSGLTLRDIVDRIHKSGQPVTEGLIHFLDENLFGSDKQVNVSEVRLMSKKHIFFIFLILAVHLCNDS